MKKILPFLLSLFLCGNLFAAEGDTTHVRVHDDVHMDWNGNFDSLAVFPDEGKSYRKILMKYTLGCPTNGCSEWDYTTKIKLREITPTDTFWVELGRLITPYANGFTDEWEQAHYYDVTDYAPVLKGNKLLRARYDGWQDGFTVTLDFYFIEGTPPRDPKRVQTVYDGYFQYGNPSNPIENGLTPYNFTLQGDEELAAFHFIPTGHSFGGNENCAEFCPKNYYVELNGNQVAQQLIWDDNCGNNPLFPQPGTWLYDRANWCPGTRGTRFMHNFNSGLVSGQNTVDINMQPFTHTGPNGDPGYNMYGGLITFGGYNFNNDVEMIDILAPSTEFNYNRMNPICANPIVKIRNSGGTTLTSAQIEYWVEGGEKFTYEWTGSLAPLEEETVEILSGENNFLDKAIGGPNKFYAKVSLPNGVADEYEINNQLSSTYEVPNLLSDEFYIWWKANSAASETSWKIVDENGFVHKQSSPLQANQNVKDTVQLGQGCYKLIIEDSDCDGLNFWANNDGNGYVRIHEMDNSVIEAFQSDFGCKIEYSFSIGYTVGTNTKEVEDIINVFPNPAEDQLTIEVFKTQTTELTAEVYSVTGKLVLQQQLGKLNGSVENINISDLSSGMYLIRVTGEDVDYSEKFMKK